MTVRFLPILRRVIPKLVGGGRKKGAVTLFTAVVRERYIGTPATQTQKKFGDGSARRCAGRTADTWTQSGTGGFGLRRGVEALLQRDSPILFELEASLLENASKIGMWLQAMDYQLSYCVSAKKGRLLGSR